MLQALPVLDCKLNGVMSQGQVVSGCLVADSLFYFLSPAVCTEVGWVTRVDPRVLAGKRSTGKQR